VLKPPVSQHNPGLLELPRDCLGSRESSGSSGPVSNPVSLTTRLAFVLGALAAFSPFSTDAVLPASLTIAAALGSDAGDVAGSVAAFFAGVGLGQLLHGPLSDRLGRRLPLFAGLSLFTLASAGCALATDIEALWWLRFVQGLGGCAGTVASRAVIRDVAAGEAGVRMLSRLILVSGMAPVIAPILGGALLEHVGWRAIFAALTVYGLFLLALVARVLPETLPMAARRHDGLVAILRVYSRLLRNRGFLGHALAWALPQGGMFAYIAGSPFLLMQVHGLSPASYVLVFSVNAAAFVLAAQAASWTASRWGAESALRTAQAALLIVAAGLFVAVIGDLGLVPLLVLFALYLAGCGALMPLSVGLAMAPHGCVAGSAASLLGALQFGGGAAAVALLGHCGGTAVALSAIMATAALSGLLARLFFVIRPVVTGEPPSTAP